MKNTFKIQEIRYMSKGGGMTRVLDEAKRKKWSRDGNSPRSRGGGDGGVDEIEEYDSYFVVGRRNIYVSK